VEDTILTVIYLTTLGRADPARLCVRGGSAGGYTVLQALCDTSRPTLFAAACAMFGISDLAALARDMHKFELRFTEKLLGGTPESIPEVYKARSPLYQAGRILTPLLVCSISNAPGGMLC
jgi:dipeptidyl aminopeptidase/acylaminoacyl peptidase